MKLEHKSKDVVEQPKPLISLISELVRAADTIGIVDDVNYRRKTKSSGSIGAQFRHNLDFISAFLKGSEIGRINYGARERDAQVENDRRTAIAQIRELKIRLEQLETRSMLNCISVMSEIDSGLWFPSSLLRELEFVLSHTIHHHALIAEKLLSFGIQIDKEFGVAPSTLRFWKKQAA